MTKRSSSITIDISCHRHDVVPVLAHLIQSKKKVQSVHLIVSRPMKAFLGNETILRRIFDLLCQVCNLTHLKIDLAHSVMLPVMALVTVLKHVKGLQKIEFHRLELSGTDETGLSELRDQLRCYVPLQNLLFLDCRGTVAVHTFFKCLPCLRSLSLLNLPDFTDLHMLLLLSSGKQALGRLHELHLISNSLTSLTGNALCRALAATGKDRLIKLTLRLDWEKSAATLAELLHAVPSLQEVDFMLYGRHITENYLLIINALPQQGDKPKKLRSLRLRSECQSRRVKLDRDELFKALDNMLVTNTTLRKVIFDFDTKYLVIPDHIKTKLRLNRCNASSILRFQSGLHPQFLNAIIREKDHIDVIYSLLSSNPSICQYVQSSSGENDTNKIFGTMSSTSLTTKPWGVANTMTPFSKLFPVNLSTNGKGLRRKVLSMFAPSA